MSWISGAWSARLYVSVIVTANYKTRSISVVKSIVTAFSWTTKYTYVHVWFSKSKNKRTKSWHRFYLLLRAIYKNYTEYYLHKRHCRRVRRARSSVHHNAIHCLEHLLNWLQPKLTPACLFFRQIKLLTFLSTSNELSSRHRLKSKLSSVTLSVLLEQIS